ncbi:MAG: abortive infection family protein [Oscillibacter sp.]|nr:abortive infection family protein [Oscillibacter sp.]
MGQYDFSYEIPDNFSTKFVHFLRNNDGADIVQALSRCNFEYEDLGLAYYAGLKGDTWDRKALDFTITGAEKDISILKCRKSFLKERIQQFLRPSSSGFLVRNVDLLVIDDDKYGIVLPQEQGETFEILANDIYNALAKNEPTLVLDRLHTYSTRFLRDICRKHNILIANDKGEHYALQILAGSLAKYYKAIGAFQSDFVYQTLKMSIGTFEKYNSIRNLHSYAHDNNVLNNSEATYVVRIVTATLSLIHELEHYEEPSLPF